MGAQVPFDEPTRFMNAYNREHGLEGDLTSDALNAVLERADEARECFKRSRVNSNVTVDHSTLTRPEKYRRRLENNKKSAAATRVYNEVLRKEFARALRDMEISERQARDELAHVKTLLKNAQQLLLSSQLTSTSLCAHQNTNNNCDKTPTTTVGTSSTSDQSVPRCRATFITESTTLRPLKTLPPPPTSNRRQCKFNDPVRRASSTLEPQLRSASPLGNRALLRFRLPAAIRQSQLPPPVSIMHKSDVVNARESTSPILPPPIRSDINIFDESKSHPPPHRHGVERTSSTQFLLPSVNRLDDDVRIWKRPRSAELDENNSECRIARR